jgi:hypothetical protein
LAREGAAVDGSLTDLLEYSPPCAVSVDPSLRGSERDYGE